MRIVWCPEYTLKEKLKYKKTEVTSSIINKEKYLRAIVCKNQAISENSGS